MMHNDAKVLARTLRASLRARGTEISHADALETIARLTDLPNWDTLSARLKPERQEQGRASDTRQTGGLRQELDGAVMIVGGPGSGRTNVLMTLAQHAGNRGQRVSLLLDLPREVERDEHAPGRQAWLALLFAHPNVTLEDVRHPGDPGHAERLHTALRQASSGEALLFLDFPATLALRDLPPALLRDVGGRLAAFTHQDDDAMQMGLHAWLHGLHTPLWTVQIPGQRGGHQERTAAGDTAWRDAVAASFPALQARLNWLGERRPTAY